MSIKKTIKANLGILSPSMLSGNTMYSNNVSFESQESELFFYPDDRIRMTFAKRRDVALDLNTGKLRLKEDGNVWKESRIDLFDVVEELREWALESSRSVFDIHARERQAKKKFPNATDKMLEIRAFIDIKETLKYNDVFAKKIVREVHHDDLVERSE